MIEQDAEQAVYIDQDDNPVEIGNYSFYDTLGRNTSKFWNVTASQEPLSNLLSYQDSSVYGGCGNKTAVCDVFRYSNFGGATAYTDGFFANQHKSYWYDSFGRVLNESVTLVDVVADLTDLAYGDGEFSTDYHYYENYNLLKQTIYKRKDQGIYSVVNHYDVFGQLRAQYESKTDTNPDGHLLMGSNDFNFRGQPESRTLYSTSSINSATTYYDYYANGQIKAIDHGSLDGAQTFAYQYDAWGNITAQTLNGSVKEVFKYDELQRITSSWVGNVPANKITYEYDFAGLGNLIKKSDYSMDQQYDPRLFTQCHQIGGFSQ